MAKENIGHMPCPCCGEDAPVREATNKRAYITCTSPVCGFQGFCRSGDADKAMRLKMKPIAAALASLPPPIVKPPTLEQMNKQAPPPQPKKKGFFDDLIIN